MTEYLSRFEYGCSVLDADLEVVAVLLTGHLIKLDLGASLPAEGLLPLERCDERARQAPDLPRASSPDAKDVTAVGSAARVREHLK